MVATNLGWIALVASLAGPCLAQPGRQGQVADRVVRSLPPLLEAAAERAASKPVQACGSPEGSSAAPPTVGVPRCAHLPGVPGLLVQREHYRDGAGGRAHRRAVGARR